MALTKTAALDLLRRAHETQRLAHAYLIAGPTGSGKRELAMELSEFVTGEPATGSSYRDLHTIEPESKSRRIVIEQVRDVEKQLQMRSTYGGKKVAIIFEADRLVQQAANA